ncbi:glycosyltransferase family 2 protein [Bacillus sp. ISL-40]|uniref:glycosyltransferase family 2 protein n=1 Tax=unclassified Bacillus (in: firmicutes) TaxID=185979 RepID=UPI001BE613BD|nr:MULTISPECIES: glycosyltransferase family 2 protein [unclassified Bacillus (in: firmicutes)]MBT2701614.1 glycosyltransferase family 2 protein [Bacillus sp. ISL-40]MBT2744340.1 glycosyltransferase family 2 protein [Bacillus sp. ISL-77]
MKVSVLITVYNGESFVKYAIDSILNQTYKDFELIIVNDGSLDGTKEILDQINDHRVKVFHFDKNKGVAFARNFGVEKANGDWIVMQDSDDISLPQRIEKQINFIKLNSDLVAVGSLVKVFLEENYKINPGIKEWKKGINYWFNSKVTREDINRAKFNGCPVVHSALTISKAALLKSGGYDCNYKCCEDYDLIMKLLELGPIENVPEILCRYRIRFSSRSRSNSALTNKEINLIAIKYLVRECYSNKDSIPNFIVFGTQKACNTFNQNLENNKLITVLEYLYNYDNKENLYKYIDIAFQQFMDKKINGILVFDGPHAKKIIKNLENKGMGYNKNLFKIFI